MRSDDLDSVGELYTEDDFRQLVVASRRRQLLSAASASLMARCCRRRWLWRSHGGKAVGTGSARGGRGWHPGDWLHREGQAGTASSHWSRWLHWHYRCLDVKPERTECRFDVELGNRGMWYATSPDVKVLLVARTGQYCREGPAARSAWLKQHTAPTILTPPSLDAERHPERLQDSVR